MSTYSEVEPAEQEWLWPGRIPAGEVTIIAGNGGVGKGFLMADLVARVTRGDSMPDGAPGFPAGVILITPEDDPATSTVHRLRAAGAELGAVHDLTETDSGPFVLPDDVPALREMITEAGDIRLVIIDPLSAPSSVSLAFNVTVRRNIMGPLTRLAKDTGVSVLIVHHTVKSGAIAASKGLTDAARSVLTVRVDPSNPAIRILAVEKTNIAAAETPAVRYTVTGEWPATRVEYVTEDPARPAAQQGSAGEAEVLAQLGAAGRPASAQEIAAALRIPYPAARPHLGRLVMQGQAVSPARGWYAAASPSASTTGASGAEAAADFGARMQAARESVARRLAQRTAELRAAAGSRP